MVEYNKSYRSTMHVRVQIVVEVMDYQHELQTSDESQLAIILFVIDHHYNPIMR
jgi:hypothetical protein